jgi:hypothetical protein
MRCRLKIQLLAALLSLGFALSGKTTRHCEIGTSKREMWLDEARERIFPSLQQRWENNRQSSLSGLLPKAHLLANAQISALSRAFDKWQ